eukprot:gene10535-2662_t
MHRVLHLPRLPVYLPACISIPVCLADVIGGTANNRYLRQQRREHSCALLASRPCASGTCASAATERVLQGRWVVGGGIAVTEWAFLVGDSAID